MTRSVAGEEGAERGPKPVGAEPVVPPLQFFFWGGGSWVLDFWILLERRG